MKDDLVMLGEPKVKVYQQKFGENTMFDHIWHAGCTACFQIFSYWNPYAALGVAVYHPRSCSGFRYALHVERPGQSPVVSAVRISSSSGRQRIGGSIQVGPPWVEPSGLAEIGRLLQAPFGRCSECAKPLTIAFDPKTFQAIAVCREDHGR
jgi:hypothetical protein